MTVDTQLAATLSELPQGTDADPLPIAEEAEYDESWRWPPEFETWLTTHLPGNATVVNLAAGNSPLGDIKIDGYPHHDDIYIDDISDLSLPDNTADCVLSDPPWKVQDSKTRKKWFAEAVRITRPRGIIIYNAGWEPTHDHAELLDTRVRVDDDGATATYLTLYEVNPPADAAGEAICRQYRGDSASPPSLPRFDSTPRTPDHREAYVYRTYVNDYPDAGEFDPRIVDPSDDTYLCPHCNSPYLLPHPDIADDPPGFECQECNFRALRSELLFTGGSTISNN
jgi:hypothetical protein